MFGRSSEATRRQSRRYEGISPTRIEPVSNESESIYEKQSRHAFGEESEAAYGEKMESARESEVVCMRDTDNVSGFILASRLADMRLPPDEYFPSRPLRAIANRDKNNLRSYRLANASVLKSDTPSLFLPEAIREAGENGENNENRPYISRWNSWRRPVPSEDKRGRVSDMCSTIVGKLAFKPGPNPALKNKDKFVSSKYLTPKVGTTLTIMAGSNYGTIAGSRSVQLGRSNDEAIAATDMPVKNSTTVKKASNRKYRPTAENKSSYKNKGKSKGTIIDTFTVENNDSPPWVSISRAMPVGQIKPAHENKGQGEVVLVEGAQRNGIAQTGGSVPDGYCAIMGPSAQHCMTQPKGSVLSDSRTLNIERLQDYSGRAKSGDSSSMVMTKSSKRRLLPDPHPKLPDRTFPTQPLHQLKPSMQKSYFAVRHCDGSSSESSSAGPSSTTGFKGAISVLVENKLLADKLEVQNSVKEQLHVKSIPSPTHRTTKSLTDTAVGFLYSDRGKLNFNEEWSLSGSDVLD